MDYTTESTWSTWNASHFHKRKWAEQSHCDKKQSRDLDGLQTHDPVPKLDHNLKLRGPPATNSRLFLITFHRFPAFFFGGFSLVKKHGPTIKKEKHHSFFTGEKNRAISRLAGFPITKDLMIEDNKKITGISGCTLSISFWIDPGESWRKTTEIHLGETGFIRQNWPILGQCSLNLLLLEHLCQ